MKNKYTLLKTKNYKKKYKKQKNYEKVKFNIIYILISLLFILFVYSFFRKIFSKNKNSTSQIINNQIPTNSDYIIPKANYTGGKLFYNNNQNSLDLFKIRTEIKTYEHFQISFSNKSDFIRREKPKVSVVMVVHDQEKDIKRIYSSIQKQELKDIEIIFVDDNSKDNTSSVIKDLMNYDQRIIYLKNEEMKRAFYSRNKGILNSSGEYILVIDPDDLLLNNILLKAYITAKKYDLDMVQFYAMMGYFIRPNIWRNLRNKEGILKSNAAIRNNFFYCISRNLWDKLVRREVYIKSINFMKEEFKNEVYLLNNDDTAFFGLVHVTETYGFLEEIGYFYIIRPKGTICYRNDPKNADLIVRTVFNNMRYFFIQSDDNKEEKRLLAYKYYEKNVRTLKEFIGYLKKDFDYDFVLGVFDLYLNSLYFDEKQRRELDNLKKVFKDKKEKNQK